MQPDCPLPPAVLLSLENRPVDLLNTLNDMVADMCYIPGAALAPNADGLSLVAEWVPLHYDVMKARAAGQYADEVETEEDGVGGIRWGAAALRGACLVCRCVWSCVQCCVLCCGHSIGGMSWSSSSCSMRLHHSPGSSVCHRPTLAALTS